MPNRHWSSTPGVGRPGPGRPRRGALDRGSDDPGLGGQRRAHVQHHLDVGAEGLLDGDGGLGREPDEITVVGRAEGGAVVVDLRLQGEDLVAAGVGEDVAGPVHEAVEPAQGRHRLVRRDATQVVGVGQHHLEAKALQVDRRQVPHRAPGGHGHEARRAKRAPGGRDHPGPRRPVGRLDGDGRLQGARSQEHGVAEGEESVTAVQGRGVEIPPAVADKGVDQHEQAGSGHVEVGEQDVHPRELVAPPDEQVGGARGGAGRRPGLEGPDHRRADGDDALGPLDGVHRRLGDDVALGVDRVVLHPFGPDRGEGAETDFQVDLRHRRPGGDATVEHVRGEVQAGGGGGGGARTAGEHRLVALRVVEGGGDVGRQGQRAQAVHQRQRLLVTQQLHGPFAVADGVADQEDLVAVALEHRARRHPAGRPHQRGPLPVPRAFGQEHLDGAAGRLGQAEAGRDDPGVVHHQQVTGPHQGREVRHRVVLRGLVGPSVHQEPGGVPGLDRRLGDGGLRQVVREVLGAHGPQIRFWPRICGVGPAGPVPEATGGAAVHTRQSL